MKTINRFSVIMAAMVMVLFAGCSFQDEEKAPEAQLPVIMSITPNVTTVLNIEKELTVTAQVEDQGILSYQWYVSESMLSKGSAIENANKQSYMPLVTKVGTSYYYCVISNKLADSTRSVISPIITYIVDENISAKAPVIIEQPASQSLEMGKNFVLYVVAYSPDEGSLSYQWFKITDETEEALMIPQATANKYTGIMSAATLGSYYCVITNNIEDNGDGGKKTSSVTTSAVSLAKNVVNALSPIITTQPVDSIVSIPAVKVLSVGAYTIDEGTLSYQWYLKESDSAEDIAIEGATESKYKILANQKCKNGYYCIITNTLSDNGDGGVKTSFVKSSTAWVVAVEQEDDNNISAPVFTKQPVAMNIALYNQSIELSCEAKSAEGTVFYRWYQSSDGTTGTGTPIAGANKANFKTPVFTEKGIYYYYCVATNVIDDVKSVASFSDVVSVAYTGLPVVVINTVDGEEPTAEYVRAPAGASGAGIKNATKVPSRMQIFKYGQNEAVYDSGEYNKKNKTGLTIKIRGNTSAYSAKKPYKLKLQTKADLLDDFLPKRSSKCKDKNWILLKDATSLNTFVGMSVADIAGTLWTPDFIFVNVVINGDYRGVYLLIESIEQSEARINVSDNGYIIERDAYWWNEDVNFTTSLYNQQYTFKYPDPEDIQKNLGVLEYIKNYMDELELHVQNGTYEECLDVTSFARWLLIHDILGTWDSGGSNIYMSKYDNTQNSKIFMETTWDYDTIYRMNDVWANQHNGDRIYAKPMLDSVNSAFKNSYKLQWNNLSSTLWNNLSSKLDELKVSQGTDINLSRQYNAKRWDLTVQTVEDDIAVAESWFTSRIVWLNSEIDKL